VSSLSKFWLHNAAADAIFATKPTAYLGTWSNKPTTGALIAGKADGTQGTSQTSQAATIPSQATSTTLTTALAQYITRPLQGSGTLPTGTYTVAFAMLMSNASTTFNWAPRATVLLLSKAGTVKSTVFATAALTGAATGRSTTAERTCKGTFSLASSISYADGDYLCLEVGVSIARTATGSAVPAVTSYQDGSTDLSTLSDNVATSQAGGYLLLPSNITVYDAPTDTYGSTIYGTTGLVGYWRLGEASGTNAGDLKGNPGTYSGVTLGATGITTGGDKAASFDGVAANVNIPDANGYSPSQTNALSVEAWVYFPSVTPGGLETLVAKGNGTDGYEWSLRASGSGGIEWIVWDQFGGNVADSGSWPSDGAMTTGRWYHCVGTYQTTSPKLVLYINGAWVADSTGAEGGTSPSNTAAPVTIGDRSDNSQYLAGVIDEVSIYSVVLTSTQVADHFTKGNPPTPATKDVASRFRLAAQKLVDIASRFKLVSPATWRVNASRFKLASPTSYRDLSTKLKVVSAQTYRFTSLRYFVVGQAWRTISIRLRVQSPTTYRDLISRYKVRAQAYVNNTLRFALIATTPAWRFTSSRLAIRSANIYKDLSSKFRLVSQATFQNLATRYKLASPATWRVSATRYLIRSSNAWRDSPIRLRIISPVTWQFVASRVRVQVQIWRTSSARFAVRSPSTYRDQVARALIRALTNRDNQTRFNLTSSASYRFSALRTALRSPSVWRDAAGRFKVGQATTPRDQSLRARIRALTYTNTPLRAAVRAQAWSAVQSRLRLRSPQTWRDGSLRARLAALSYVFTPSRFRLFAQPTIDVRTRVALRASNWRIQQIRYSVQVINTKDTSFRSRVRALITRDDGTRYRIRSVIVYRDNPTRLIVQSGGYRFTSSRTRIQSSLTWISVPARVSVRSIAWQFIATRLRVVTGGARDGSTRFKLRSPSTWAFALSRFALSSPNAYRFTQARARISVGVYANEPTRYRLRAQSFRHIATLFNIGNVGRRYSSARYRLIAHAVTIISSRFRLQSPPTYKSVPTRFKIRVYTGPEGPLIAVTSSDTRSAIPASSARFARTSQPSRYASGNGVRTTVQPDEERKAVPI
jgi:hypothetical protein